MPVLHDHSTCLSRRQFGTLAAGAAVLGLMPGAALAAADIEALCVTCIDYRFVAKDVSFAETDLELFKEFDICALAGASLAGVSVKIPQSVPAFWNQLNIARDLHKIKRLVLIDHRECGAFEVEYGRKPANPAEETAWHLTSMRAVAQRVKTLPFPLAVEGWLMPLKGCAEKLL